MAAATVQQIQNFSDQQARPICEQAYQLYLAMSQAKAQIGDVYSALTGSQSGWTDARTDGPPHLATASDLLAFNEFITNILAAFPGDASWPVIESLVVRQLNG